MVPDCLPVFLVVGLGRLIVESREQVERLRGKQKLRVFAEGSPPFSTLTPRSLARTGLPWAIAERRTASPTPGEKFSLLSKTS